MKIDEICRQNGISNATYYNWKRNTVAWNLLILNGLKSLRMRIPDLKSCLRKSAWKIMLWRSFLQKMASDNRKEDLRSGINSGRFIGHSRLSVSFTAQWPLFTGQTLTGKLRILRLSKRFMPNWNYHHGPDSGSVFTGCDRKSTPLIINGFTGYIASWA